MASNPKFPFKVTVAKDPLYSLTQHVFRETSRLRDVEVNPRTPGEISLGIYNSSGDSDTTRYTVQQILKGGQIKELTASRAWNVRSQENFTVDENTCSLTVEAAHGAKMIVRFVFKPDDEKEAAQYPFSVELCKADGTTLPTKPRKPGAYDYSSTKFTKYLQLQGTAADLVGFLIRITNHRDRDIELEGGQDRPGMGTFPFGDGSERWHASAGKKLEIANARMYEDSTTVELRDQEHVYGVVIYLPDDAFANDARAQQQAKWGASGQDRYEILKAGMSGSARAMAKLDQIEETEEARRRQLPVTCKEY